jgi:hypothetical protein
VLAGHRPIPTPLRPSHPPAGRGFPSRRLAVTNQSASTRSAKTSFPTRTRIPCYAQPASLSAETVHPPGDRFRFRDGARSRERNGDDGGGSPLTGGRALCHGCERRRPRSADRRRGRAPSANRRHAAMLRCRMAKARSRSLIGCRWLAGRVFIASRPSCRGDHDRFSARRERTPYASGIVPLARGSHMIPGPSGIARSTLRSTTAQSATVSAPATWTASGGDRPARPPSSKRTTGLEPATFGLGSRRSTN